MGVIRWMKGESNNIQLEVETALYRDDPTYNWRSHLSKKLYNVFGLEMIMNGVIVYEGRS